MPGRSRDVAEVPKADYDRTVVFRRKLDAVHPTNCPTSQPIKPRNGMGAVSAEITKAMPKPASKILGAGPGQIIAMIGKLSMASITPMPCPASKTLETIVQARENNKTFGRDIATTESHIADRAEPKFGHRRQVKYKATNGPAQRSSYAASRVWGDRHGCAAGCRFGSFRAARTRRHPRGRRRHHPRTRRHLSPGRI